ncbi:U3 small nucleolar RNA-associated protein, partial [Elasticomyces elasticus]
MDIHRSRFVPYPPSSIQSLAFSRSSETPTSNTALKLAIGRSNGNVEIWNPLNGAWVHEVTFSGGERRSIEALVWTQEPDDTDSEGRVSVGQLRLFSIANTAAVTEWDLATGTPLRQSTGNFSEVWALAAQPPWTAPHAVGTEEQAPRRRKAYEEEWRGQNLVAGCADGTLVVLSTAENDLQFKRFLARASSKKARCISLVYQNRDIVIAGFANSNIRIYDSRNGSLIRNMSLGVGVPGAPRDTLVWSLKCLPNGDVVSADSNGEVRIWDGKTYSLLQRVVGHESDCLDIAVGQDGQTVFSGGMDGKVAIYKRFGREGERRHWVRISHRRIHQGDINALASYEGKNLSVVVSGDMAPVVHPLRSHGREHHMALPYLPQEPPITNAPLQRLLVSWWKRVVCVWRVASLSDPLDTAQDRGRQLVAKLTLKGTEDITSVDISEDGRVLAVVTSKAVKVFQLRVKQSPGEHARHIRKLETPLNLAAMGARLVRVSPDARWLAVIALDSEVHVARLTTDPANPKKLKILQKTVELDRAHRKLKMQNGMEHYDRTITRLAFSADGAVLVAGDLSGYLDSWVLQGHEDSTAPAVDLASTDPSDGSSAASSTSSISDSDSDEDDEKTVVFYGQHWADNPSAHLLPKLDSAPLLL